MEAIKTFPKFSILFVLLMALEIAGLTVIPTFHMVSKAMIMACIIGFYILTERNQNNAFLSGLIFALLGDCFLLYDTVEFFVIGLICFLIMQLCYTAAFNRKRRVPKNKDYLISAGIVIIALFILSIIWPDLGSMRTPVLLYTAAIVLMAIFAYMRHPKLRGYNILLIGVILFIVSDSLLALDKFSGTLPYGQILVMTTYMLAQYFIVSGEVLANIPKAKVSDTSKTQSSFWRHLRT